MEADALHDLTAAYAVDALDPREQREYEEHLARCERCRDELASLSEAASSLAYGVESPAPPPQLRERILAQALAERPNVVPLRPRWAIPAAVAAVAAAAAAIVLGIWAASLSHKVDSLRSARDRQERVAAILSAPGAQRFTSGDRIRLVVTPSDQAALVVARLAPAHRGMVYEAWVAVNGKPEPAGTFQSSGKLTAVPLEQPVSAGATVLVTEERHRVDAPTTMPFIKVST